jgi:hypothetical protein
MKETIIIEGEIYVKRKKKDDFGTNGMNLVFRTPNYVVPAKVPHREPHPCYNCGGARHGLCVGEDGEKCRNLKYR